MGYTNYWERTEKPITEDFVKAVKDIIKESERLGINICGWNGSEEPTITTNVIAFNGDKNFDLEHEPFLLNNVKTGFAFCKTVRKPYDWTVKEVLATAEAYGLVTDVSNDGEVEHKSDKQWLFDKYNSLSKRLFTPR